jgi:cytochrome c peroxidase
VKPILMAALAVAIVACGLTGSVTAQSDPLKLPRWAIVVHQRALQVRDTGKSDGTPGIFPPVIPKKLDSADASGVTETYNLGAPTVTASSPFFQSLGANGRACVTCHEPRSGWGVSVASIQQRFAASNGDDPIFRVIDGATCDTDDVSTLQAKQIAYSLLLSKGLIRIFLPLPAAQLGSNPPAPPDFQIVNVSDPYSCTDLGSSPPIVSVYRRPLPAANLRFLTECPDGNPACAPLAIMWDGREPSLASQAIDATLGHAQAPNPPTPDQVTRIVNFESQIYDAQQADNAAGRLDQGGADGGPQFLSQQDFFIGINDSLSPGFDNVVFTLYAAWEGLTGSSERDQARAAIARGQRIFNARQFTISGVNGLNRFPGDPLGANPLTTGTCTTCHDSPNVGNHSLKLALDIGVADANPPALDNSGLPVFTVQCTDVSGPLAGQTFTVTDLGRAMITGKCADVGKFKGPILHALASRAPYFHNGAAATLNDVVNFYDQRFSIGLSDQDKSDLVAFLQTL